MVLAAVDHDGLAALLVLEDKDAVLEVEVDSELIVGKVDAPELASLQRHLLPFDFLEEVEVLRVELYCSHLGENCVKSSLVLGGEQEAVLVDVGVKLFDHFRLVVLEVLLGSHGDAQENHVASCDHLVHLAAHPVQQ